jgi:hypothetical protein
MSRQCCWWTHGVALVRLWDSACGSTKNKWKKEHRQLYCVKGADYGHGGGPKAGLCRLNRQERQRRPQERTEMMRNTFRNFETDWKRLYEVMYDMIQSNDIMFCSYKVHDFILLFRCHPRMDFDIRQRESPLSDLLSFRLPLHLHFELSPSG